MTAISVDVIYARNLKPGDWYAGNYVPDAPTTPAQTFAAAFPVDFIFPVTENGQEWLSLVAGSVARTPVLATSRVLVIRGLPADVHHLILADENRKRREQRGVQMELP